MKKRQGQYLQKRVLDLEAKLKKAEGGAKEVCMLVDALMVQVVKACGTQTDEGYKLELPNFDVQTLLQQWDVKVAKTGAVYEIRIKPKEA